MTRTERDRSHLSIGEVLSLLQDDFPDVTISKIRFLESQGLLDPERTPSGYRKFYESDIDRLRWILREQKEHYLPLKVIKDRLDGAGAPPTPKANGGHRASPATAERPDDRDDSGDPATTVARPSPPRSSSSRPADPVADTLPLEASPAMADAGRGRSPAHPETGARAGRGVAFDPGPGSVSLTIEELVEASGTSVRDVRDLERYGLIEGQEVGDALFYDGDALVIARAAAGFLQHGVEARHMRPYKVAVDREAGLFQQIVLPLLKQRNPEARKRAARTVAELIRLGEVLRGVLLRRELGHIGDSG